MGDIGCCYLGKNVSYPGGEYEEMGKTFLDIVSPHCMLVVGKRGTGKSYTLGVLAEGFADLDDKYSDRIALVIVDTMSVFHSLKKENSNEKEIALMDNFGIQPENFEERVKILVPQAAIDKAKESENEIYCDEVLKIPLRDVNVHEWLELFDLSITEPEGFLLSKVITRLKKQGRFSFDDIYNEIDETSEKDEHGESLKNLFTLIEELKLFSKDGMGSDIAEGGKITVLDISYLGRLGGYELRNLIVSIFSRQQMAMRTLYTTIEMQSQAGITSSETKKDITEDHPLIYMVIDEAHLFLPNGKKTLATDPLIDWIKLGRHPGLSLILATQEPSALHESAIRQSDIIIAHNVTARDDIAALGMAKQSYMNKGLDELVAQMDFKRGLSIVFDDKTRKMQLSMVRPRLTHHTGVDASALPPDER